MLDSNQQINCGSKFLGLSIVLLIFTYCYTVFYLTNTERVADYVAHTYQVKEQIQKLYSGVRDLERTQRSYLLTSDIGYLNQYQTTVRHTENTAKSIQDLTQDNPVQQRNLIVLKNLIQQRRVSLQNTITVKNQFCCF